MDTFQNIIKSVACSIGEVPVGESNHDYTQAWEELDQELQQQKQKEPSNPSDPFDSEKSDGFRTHCVLVACLCYATDICFSRNT